MVKGGGELEFGEGGRHPLPRNHRQTPPKTQRNPPDPEAKISLDPEADTHSRDSHRSGRYASYWNEFLYEMCLHHRLLNKHFEGQTFGAFIQRRRSIFEIKFQKSASSLFKKNSPPHAFLYRALSANAKDQ